MERAAAASRCREKHLAQRLVSAGFAFLLKASVLQGLSRAGRRRG